MASSDSPSHFRALLDAQIEGRQVNKILHTFPSQRFWQECKVPMEQVLGDRQRFDESEPAELELYVSLPYCIATKPERCGFCLFPVEEFEGMHQLTTYLEFLHREGEMYRKYYTGKAPISIYIGGGTPNLLKAQQYAVLMDIIRETFPELAPGAGVTLEGIPQLFTYEKLIAIKEAGMNRISMGAEQLNAELNLLSGRRQRPEHVYQTVEWAREIGLDCNVDLIFGWPRQTMETMLEDMNKLIATGVPHITHYELNVGGQSDFALNRRHELPSVAETRAMYHAARELLEQNGYRQLTPYEFEKRVEGNGDRFVYEECRRTFRRRVVRGWGFASVSDLPGTGDTGGWCFVNHRNVARYFDGISSGGFPVERGFRREIEDLRLSLLFRNLQSFHVDRMEYLQRFGLDVIDEHAVAWQVLAERELVEILPDEVGVTVKGGYYVPLIQTMLARNRVEVLIDRHYRKARGQRAEIPGF